MLTRSTRQRIALRPGLAPPLPDRLPILLCEAALRCEARATDYRLLQSDRLRLEIRDRVVGPEHDQDIPRLQSVFRPRHEAPLNPVPSLSLDREHRNAKAIAEPGLGDGLS